jgi:hypothetical protein
MAFLSAPAPWALTFSKLLVLHALDTVEAVDRAEVTSNPKSSGYPAWS